jgi:hypothetical protein
MSILRPVPLFSLIPMRRSSQTYPFPSILIHPNEALIPSVSIFLISHLSKWGVHPERILFHLFSFKPMRHLFQVCPFSLYLAYPSEAFTLNVSFSIYSHSIQWGTYPKCVHFPYISLIQARRSPWTYPFPSILIQSNEALIPSVSRFFHLTATSGSQYSSILRLPYIILVSSWLVVFPCDRYKDIAIRRISEGG